MSTITAPSHNIPDSARLRGLYPWETAATFARSLVARAESALEPTDPGDAPAGTPSRDVGALSQRLESALADTVSFVADKHGDKAGTAMMGLMAKSLGDGEVDEASLSKSLLNVVKFVDQNFGIEEGDALIDHLNGSLNDSLNAFFDNGRNEQFIAKTTPSPTDHNIDTSIAEHGPGTIAGMADNILAVLESYKARRKKAGPKLPYETDTGLPAGAMVDAAA